MFTKITTITLNRNSISLNEKNKKLQNITKYYNNIT